MKDADFVFFFFVSVSLSLLKLDAKMATKSIYFRKTVKETEKTLSRKRPFENF